MAEKKMAHIMRRSSSHGFIIQSPGMGAASTKSSMSSMSMPALSQSGNAKSRICPAMLVEKSGRLPEKLQRKDLKQCESSRLTGASGVSNGVASDVEGSKSPTGSRGSKDSKEDNSGALLLGMAHGCADWIAVSRTSRTGEDGWSSLLTSPDHSE